MNVCLSHHTLHKDLDELAHAAEDAFADFAGTQDAGAVPEALEDVVADGFLFAVDVRFHEGRELVDKLQDAVEDAVQSGKINNQQAGETVAFYERSLADYTYLTTRRK